MKINLYIGGNALDVYQQDITWEWSNIRFSDGIKDAYSTDMKLPKTKNNMQLLEVSGLLDSTSQLYGTQLTESTLIVAGTMMDVYIEMVSITDDDINICLYQRTLPEKLFGKKIRSFVADDYNSIYVWSVNTLTAYPQAFPTYNYGSAYNQKMAMKHPTKKLNDVITAVNAQLQNFTLPLADDDFMLMGAHKNVCPQNTRQVIEFACNLSDHELLLAGGQHITNDLDGWDGHSKVLESTTTEFTFNRNCTATIHGYVSWGRKITTGLNTFMVSLLKNGQFEYGWQINTTNLGRRNGLTQSTITVNVNAGDTFSLVLNSPTANNSPDKFQLLAGVLDIEYSNYDITEDDYDTELVYCHRHPSLKQWFPDNTVYEHPFDGRTEDFYIYNWDGSLNQNDTFSMTFPWRGISYIGYFCNIGNITLKDLYFGLCWLYEKKPIREMREMFLVDANESIMLDEAVITEIRPSSSKLGQVTNVAWAGGNGKQVLTNIDSVWLDEEVTRHTSPFEYIDTVAGGLARVNQYNISCSYDEDGKTVWDVDYEEPEGAVLLLYGQYGRLNRWGLLPPPNINTMGIDELTQCMEVTIETFDIELKDKDYVYLDGRKFMVVEGSTDLDNRKTTLTALLVPTT